MSKNDLILSLNEDTFANLKKDFDTILNRTIGNMEMRGASDAVITMKLTVSLDKRSMDMGDGIQEFKKPSFKHEVSSVMQIKDKATGQLGGDYAMVWDEKEERFVLRQFTGGQTSIFDDDYEDVDDYSGHFGDLPVEGEALGLPEASVEDGTVEEEVASEDTDSTVPDDASESGEVSEKPAIDTNTPFGWLTQFAGQEMRVTEAMGNYTVRTLENRIVLSSATDVNNPFHCSAEILKDHVGHKLRCVTYGNISNVSIECEDCNVVLFDLDNPAEEEEEALDYESPEEE